MEPTTESAREAKRAYMREWKARNKTQHAALNRKSRVKRRAEAPHKELLMYARKRARKSGLEFSITAVDVVVPTHCPYLGIPLKWGVNRACDASPSLDRINPAQGYIPGNVRVISYKANAMKSNATSQQLLTFAHGIFRLHAT